MFKTTLNALTAILALGFVVGAQHATARTADTVSVKVRYGDLNLSTEAGAKVMLHRIHSAAQAICGPELSDPMQAMYVYRPCVTAITDRAVNRFGNPILTALNGGKNARAETFLASNR